MFTLHPQLEHDSILVSNLSLCQVRLINHRELTWILLIPRVANISELYELPDMQQHELMLEIQKVSKMLKTHFPCDKLNVATLGNKVPQLHIHIIARRKGDPYWPNPVWGNPLIPYKATEQGVLITALQEALQ